MEIESYTDWYGAWSNSQPQRWTSRSVEISFTLDDPETYIRRLTGMSQATEDKGGEEMLIQCPNCPTRIKFDNKPGELKLNCPKCDALVYERPALLAKNNQSAKIPGAIPIPKQEQSETRNYCQGKNGNGTSCSNTPMPNGFCHMHGGKSTKERTDDVIGPKVTLTKDERDRSAKLLESVGLT
jgi:uncharacterized C2H2 Zn-finger protein